MVLCHVLEYLNRLTFFIGYFYVSMPLTEKKNYFTSSHYAILSRGYAFRDQSRFPRKVPLFSFVFFQYHSHLAVSRKSEMFINDMTFSDQLYKRCLDGAVVVLVCVKASAVQFSPRKCSSYFAV